MQSMREDIGKLKQLGIAPKRTPEGSFGVLTVMERAMERAAMSNEQPNNPLHGVTLEQIVTRLVEHYGWAELAGRIRINCFSSNPSVKSSLRFLRRTPWARTQVEELYLSTFVKPPSPWG